MVCINTSRLNIGRPPDAEDRAQSGAGKLLWGLNAPREGVACAGCQSLGQRERDISACGEKSSPSPWSSSRGEEITSADSGFAVYRTRRSTMDRVSRWAIDRARRLDRQSSDPHPNAIPSLGGEGQDEGELAAPKAVIPLPRGSSPGQGESNQVQVEHFHHADEPCRLGHEARQNRNRRRIFHCPIAKRERIQMRFPGLKARNVKARGEAQRSPGKRPSICSRPVRPEHRCVTCAGLSGLGFSAPPARALQAGLSHRGPSALMPDPFSESVGHRPIPPAERGRGRCSATALPPRLGHWPCDRGHLHSLPGWLRRERCRRFALPPHSKMSFHFSLNT